ncbi:MAG: NAD-dependent epimerase/dehydratase family protein [Flavobacteriaceae bacterium]|jgi:nucleoside-diphosphate-sugar epimerase|nr:NAD-dependent epimerase/dehydratase family protein [Flavobacteriaceae bacterium]
MIFITGGTGILGRVIILELLKRGKKVRAAKRPTSRLQEVKSSFKFYVENPEDYFDKIEWTDVDFDDEDSLKNALQNVEEVYHCAAKISFHPDDKKEMYKTNIGYTKNLLYACENSSVKKFCFVSSIAVLDGLNENREMDENSDYNPKINHSAYSVAKHFSEMEVWRASAEGLKTVIVNPGIIIGSGNWKQGSGGVLFRNFQKNKFTFSGGVSYVDVRDVAKICVELMDKNIFGERFVLVSESMKYEDFGNIVRKKSGQKPVKVIPDFLLKFALFLSFIFKPIFPKLKIINKTNVESVTNFNKVSNQKIKKTLDYEFISVEGSVEFHLRNYELDQKE